MTESSGTEAHPDSEWFIRRTLVNSKSGKISMTIKHKDSLNIPLLGESSTPCVTRQSTKRKPTSQLDRPHKVHVRSHSVGTASIVMSRQASQILGDDTEPEEYIDKAFASVCVGCEAAHIATPRAKTVHCEYCGKTYCIKCVGISAAEYPVLKNSSAFHWFCPRCEGRAVKTLKSDKDIEERCKAFTSKMEARVEKLEGDMANKVDKADLTAEIRQAVLREFNEHRAEAPVDVGQVKDLVREELERLVWIKDERSARNNNILLFHAPEPDQDSTAEEKAEADKRLVHCLIREQLAVNCPDPESIARLGGASDQPRPLKVVLRSESDRIQIQKNCYRLRHAPEPFKSMTVASDMTRKDREQHKEMLAEARARDLNESGDWIHLVRGPPGHRKIMRVQRRGPINRRGSEN